MTKIAPQKIVYVLAGGILCTSALLGIAPLFDAPAFEVHATSEVILALKPLTVSPTAIIAKAAIVLDPATGQVLFSKNGEVSLPLASLTKLMTAETVLSVEKDNASVTITPDDLKPEGDWGFKVGETWSLGQLLKFGLVASSNDAMAAAAASAGPQIIDDMNKTAANLGLTQTYFLNPTGLDLDPSTPGAYGSAHDVARLASVFLKNYPELFESTTHASVTIVSASSTLEAASTDVPLLTIPGLIAAKTGYTDLAGGNLVAVFETDINHPLIAVVLGSTRDGRFSDTKTLIDAARATEQ
jgi:D-alanyl-D-alanine carboxypeptidase (penicillin-binding protein 5/6)